MGLTYTITKELRWEAAHVLHGLPEGHQCGRLHGHSYRASVTLVASSLDENGFVLDFGIIKEVVKDRYDHQTLNDRMQGNPTAERIAEDLFKLINEVLFKLEYDKEVKVLSVTVWETETCCATVEVGG